MKTPRPVRLRGGLGLSSAAGRPSGTAQGGVQWCLIQGHVLRE